MKRVGSFSAGDVDIADVYPLQLRLSVLREANSLGVKISKRVIFCEPVMSLYLMHRVTYSD